MHMTKLLQHIEDMRLRLKEISNNEQVLVKALGDALNRLDQQLLRDVRTIANEHEARREAILGELQGLAAGIGMFHTPIHPALAREELPTYMPAPAHQPSIAPGDWRQAASNIEDELDLRLNGRSPSH
jgi:hypothetical protein